MDGVGGRETGSGAGAEALGGVLLVSSDLILDVSFSGETGLGAGDSVTARRKKEKRPLRF